MVKRYQNTSQRTGASSRDFDITHNPGPFVAIVVNNVDPTYMGRLTVVLQTKIRSGDNPNNRENQIIVDYCPPFFGATPIQSLNLEAGDARWISGQKSYGMWFVPPDVGAQVLVIFTEGNQGYWIGCIPEAGMNFMTPGTDVATELNDRNPEFKQPVVEYKKNQVDNIPDDLTQIPKPANLDIDLPTFQRGLFDDPTRGFTTASARRETPSAVFGISTPGPKDRRVGPVRENNRAFFNRLGGSSFVMDDGDERFYRKGDAADTPSEYVDQAQDTAGEEFDNTIPHGEMMRFKTRTGHQILMHNSEDLIYIGNSRGTAWIELTSNGKIDIYSQDSISVHTETDLNFRADRDINFEAGRDFNIKANRDITQESVENFQLVVGKDNKITTKGTLDVQTEKDVRLESVEGSTNILSEDNNNFTAGKSTNILSEDNNNFTAGKDTNIKSDGDHIEETGGKIKMNGPGAEVAAESAESQEAEPLPTFIVPATNRSEFGGIAEVNTILKRIPTKEPWLHHENLAPLNFTPEKTDIKSEEPAPESGEYNPTRDTFKPANG